LNLDARQALRLDFAANIGLLEWFAAWWIVEPGNGS
jgi:hypothetical protein